MWRGLFVTCLVFLLVSVGAQASERIYLIGDSEAFLLAPILKVKAAQAGHVWGQGIVPGSSVISWSKDLPAEWGRLRRFKPSLVLVSLGANDACMGARIVANEGPFFRVVSERLSRIQARVVWLGPPKIGAERCPRKDCLTRAIAGLETFSALVKTRWQYLDAREIEVSLWDDLLHPDERGRRIWADWIWGRVASVRPDG